MSKKITLRLIAGTAIISCLYGINAEASTGGASGPSSTITIALTLGLVLVIVFKIVSSKLKKVDKDLEDNFGEKVLP